MFKCKVQSDKCKVKDGFHPYPILYNRSEATLNFVL